MTKLTWPPLRTALLLALAYFVTGRLGLLLPAYDSHITLIWLPTGIAVAALLRWGVGCWPGVALGACAVNLAVGASWTSALGITAGNTLGPLLAVWLLRRTGFQPTFARKRDILLLGAAAVSGMLIPATVGVATLFFAGVIGSGVAAAWLTWWAGDAMGVLAAAPLVLTFNQREGRVLLLRRGEFAAWLGATALAVWGVFILNSGPLGQTWSLAFVPLPLIAWAALRLGPAGTSLALVVLSIGAAFGTATGRGPFFRQNPVESVVELWLFMASGTVLGWLITALHAAWQEATKGQRLFEQALNDVSLGVLLSRLDGRISYVNSGFSRLTGSPGAESLEQSLGALRGVETDPEVSARLEAALRDGGSFEGELRCYRRDGSTFWNALVISPVHDEQGDKSGFLAILRDISRRKDTERTLEESRSRLDGILHSISDVVYSTSIDGRAMIFVSESVRALYGLEPAVFFAEPMRWMEMIHCDDRLRVERSFQEIEERGEFESDYRIVLADGVQRWVHDRGQVIRDARGTPVRFDGLVTDITGRKEAELALREGETRYRALFETNPHPMWVYDLETLRFLAVNSAAIEHYGYTQEEFLAMTIRDIRPADEIAALLENVAAVSGGLDRAGIWHHRRRSGDVIDVEISSHVLDFDGRRAEVVLAHDVTERRRMESRHANERAVLELLAAGAPLPAVLERLARSYEEVVPGAYCSVLLLDADGRRLRHGAAPSLPEEYCRAVDGVEIGPAVGSCGTAAYRRKLVVVEDIAGDPLWNGYRQLALAHGLRACWSVPIFSSRDRLLGTFAIYYREPRAGRMEEIAALERGAHFASVAIERHELFRSLQESQARLETLVGNLPGMAYRCQNDADRTMTYVSDGCAEITGYRRDELENSRGIAYGALIHPEDRSWLGPKCEAAFAARTPCQNEYRILDRRGAEHWVSDRASGVYDAEGRLIGIDGFIQDITASRKAQREREELDRKVQETQKLESLGVLAGGIAHDFNNILTAILGNASLGMSEVSPGSPVLESLEQINEAALRAADLCKQMLAYSGRGRFVVRRLDLGQLIEETTQMLQISISKKVSLRFRLEKELPLVEVDATQIRQVVMNLVINASEAIGDRSGVISLTTGLTRVDRSYLGGTLTADEMPEGDYVYLEVSDDGCGMSAETQARIFDPFFTTKFTGRGLGLAAVLGIVRGHKGALKVYSEPERGTTFKMLFPAVHGSQEGTPVPNVANPAWRGQGTVLVVDDEETIRTTVARMLRVMNLEPVLVADGREAVEVFATDPGRFAVVLLDLTMPQMDGEQTFAELRRLRADVRVVLMSGFNQQEALVRFTGKGLASFLQKPFPLNPLRDVLRRLLG